MSKVATPRYRDARVGGCVSAEVEPRADGSVILRSIESLQPYPERLTDRLAYWARETPDRSLPMRWVERPRRRMRSSCESANPGAFHGIQRSGTSGAIVPVKPCDAIPTTVKG